jgi:hypothetical protein
MDGQNGPPEPGKVEPSPEDVEFLKKIFRRIGQALSGLGDQEIEHLVGNLQAQAQTLKLFRGGVQRH